MAKVFPEGADPQIIWSSSDVVAPLEFKGVAILEALGYEKQNWSFAKVTAKINGNATITAVAAGASAFEEDVAAEQKLKYSASSK